MNKTFDRDKLVLVIGTAVLVVPSVLADRAEEDAFVEALVALRQKLSAEPVPPLAGLLESTGKR